MRVSAFIVDAGRVLLVRQGRDRSTYWLLPGGGVERGEDLESALERELREECGLRIRTSGPPLALVQTISPDAGRSRHLLQIVFPAAVLGRGPTRPSPGAALEDIDEAVLEIAWVERNAVSGLVLHPPIHDLVVSWLDPDRGLAAGPPPPCVVTAPLWTPD